MDYLGMKKKVMAPSTSDGSNGSLNYNGLPIEVIMPTSRETEMRPVFKAVELRKILLPTWRRLHQQKPESTPFLQPVDPLKLGIPDYFLVIQQPMDLSSIKAKLDNGQYNDPWDYIDDVWLMLNNAWAYNEKNSLVYDYCTKLAEIFQRDINPVMQSIGFCCGRKFNAINPDINKLMFPGYNSIQNINLPNQVMNDTEITEELNIETFNIASSSNLLNTDELWEKLLPSFRKLSNKTPHSIPFIHPIDPIALDYFDIIKQPMNLSVIESKLLNGLYQNPWEYIDDIWLIFNNAWLYNRKTSRVYNYCTKLAELFEQEIDPVMQSFGYCCGRKYSYDVLRLYTIPHRAK